MGWRDDGMFAGRWGRAGSGLLLTTGTRVLLTLRSGEVLEPWTWGVPGGAIPVDAMGRPMDALRSAMKEAQEELGRLPSMSPPIGLCVYREDRFSYTTFVVSVPESATRTRFRLNWENDAAGWFGRDELADLELHFGTEYALDELGPVLWR